MTKEEFIQRLSKRLFWDVDPATMDAEDNSPFIISRTMERGSLSDVRAVWHYYDEERIRDTLLNASSLSKKTIAFFANQFNLPCEQFRAFRHNSGTWDR